MRAHPAKALWQCRTCGATGECFGEVGANPSTPDGPGEAEFYPYQDESGAFFAGCINCGSEQVYFDDVEPAGRLEAQARERGARGRVARFLIHGRVL